MTDKGNSRIGGGGEDRWAPKLKQNTPAKKGKIGSTAINNLYEKIMRVVNQYAKGEATPSLERIQRYIPSDYKILQKPGSTELQRQNNLKLILIFNSSDLFNEEGLPETKAQELEGMVTEYLDLTSKFLQQQPGVDFDEAIDQISRADKANGLKNLLNQVDFKTLIEMGAEISQAIKDSDYKKSQLDSELVNQKTSLDIIGLIKKLDSITPNDSEMDIYNQDVFIGARLHLFLGLIISYDALSKDPDNKANQGLIKSSLLNSGLIQRSVSKAANDDSDNDTRLSSQQIEQYIASTDPLSIWQKIDSQKANIGSSDELESILELAAAALFVSLKKIDL